MRQCTKLEYMERRSMEFQMQRYQFCRDFQQEVLVIHWFHPEVGYEKLKGKIVKFISGKAAQGVQITQTCQEEFKAMLVDWMSDVAGREQDPIHQQFLNMLCTEVIDDLWRSMGICEGNRTSEFVWKA